MNQARRRQSPDALLLANACVTVAVTRAGSHKAARERAGLARTTLFRLQKRQAGMTLHTLVVLARGLGMRPSDLLREAEDMAQAALEAAQ